MNILVLGGTRFFGVHLVRELIKQGHKVTIATRGNKVDEFGDRVNRIKVDHANFIEMKNAFLNKKDLPQDKKELIIRTLSNTLLAENINKVENGESQLKRVFTKIVDDLGIYYKIGLTTDFTGKLFNEMYPLKKKKIG